ncbi:MULTISPECIES: hypothetical protein [unclassified Streptomyces]|uniref:hypothetical protein n=1 Tax=unclassified Streptomyces TaxID=2593676 RepID=UPI0036585DC5
MVTDRSHGTSRARRPAGLLRLLALTMLLMGLFCAHGTAAQDGAVHPGPGASGTSVTHAVTHTLPSGTPDSPGADHSPVHPAHECAPLPPHQAAVSEASTTAPHTDPGCVPAGRPDHRAGISPVGAGPARPVTSAVLRV